MLASQTIQPAETAFMFYAPESNDKDITQRYRRGYDQLRGKGLDVIAFFESDDYYPPDYLEVMAQKWLEHGKPDLISPHQVWYYNMRLNARLKMEGHTQAQAMSTMIKADLTFPWCPDNEAFTDVWLWNLRSHLKGFIFKTDRIMCIGMKHGVGLTGGNSHRGDDHRYLSGKGIPDPDLSFLRENLTPEAFEFYSSYFSRKDT